MGLGKGHFIKHPQMSALRGEGVFVSWQSHSGTASPSISTEGLPFTPKSKQHAPNITIPPKAIQSS